MLANTGLSGDSFSFPFINASGTVCYTAQFAGSVKTAIYATDGATTRQVAISSGTTGTSDIGLGIDSAGDVLWREILSFTNSKLWLTSPTGTNTLIADTSGTYASFSDAYSGSASLSPSGQVAFLATLKNGNVGIFTGANPVANKILKTGDPLFGSTAGTVFSLGSDALNSSGSVAFLANTLAQSQAYVVRADITPEPTTLLLLAPTLTLLLTRRRKKHNPATLSPSSN